MTVEIPKHSSNKYEYNLANNSWELDRVLSGAMFYPEEYGSVSDTLDYDGDPLDIICITEKPTFPGCRIPVRIVGVLKMIDGNEKDDKLLVVNDVDPRLKNINDLKDVPKAKLDEINHFFSHYKDLEKKKVIIQGFYDKKAAEKVLEDCQSLYKKYRHLIEKKFDKKELVKILSKDKEDYKKDE
ncbi:3945_t:CDS:1 [Ambispora leptoticha]|uniref:inorganic diphosphatase n=1 Tax=Ambispora leptoticha TaxID=144679 RepID=A0A9N8VA00_9GLOM|nr:3945_t:CDS:1 [Ambispora leptoticha]